MKLSESQIKELKDFILHKGYPEPDLHMEILDHVACLIEDKLTTQPNIPFTEALYNTYESFGTWGFRKLAKDIEKGFRNAQNQIVIKFLKKWFLSPYLLVMFLLAGLIYIFVFKYFEPVVIVLPLFILLTYFIYYFLFLRSEKKRFKNYMAVETVDRFTIWKIVGTITLSVLLQFAQASPAWIVTYIVALILVAQAFIIETVLLQAAFKNSRRLASLYP